jgi:SAM-dependent methyltransferase
MIPFPRKKKFNFIKSFFYQLDKVFFAKSLFKIKIYTYLEWIFERLAFEHYGRYRSAHGMPHMTTDVLMPFLQKFLTKEMRIIDLGCGRGEKTVLMANYVSKVVGIDHNNSELKFAISKKKKQGINNLELYNDDVVGFLEREDGLNFDVLVCSHIIEHLESPFEFLKKFINSFQYIYIEVPDYESTAINKIRIDLKLDLLYKDDDHVLEFNKDSLQAQLSVLEIKVVEQRSIYGVLQLWCENLNFKY